jgi:DNA modification methylase
LKGAVNPYASAHRVRDMRPDPNGRNRRSVWTVTTKPYKGAHFATFPPDLIKPCILAGALEGGVVLDCFLGSGTTAAVAKELGRQYLGCELNPAYIKLAKERLKNVLPPQPRLLAA